MKLSTSILESITICFNKKSQKQNQITMSRKGTQYTMESWMIANEKEGKVFYSDKMDRHITAIASKLKRKVVTERLITITTGGKNQRLII